MTMFFNPEEARAAHEHAALQQHVDRQRVSDFVASLNPEDLATLILLLNTIYQVDNSGEVASYHLGMAVMTMKTVHHRCICGADHAEEMLRDEMAKSEASIESVPMPEDVRITPESEDDGLAKQFVDTKGWVWSHVNQGDVCPSFWADRPSPKSTTVKFWWCTTHQDFVELEKP